TLLPLTPKVNATVNLTALASGGTLPYSYSWSFGDGSTATTLTTTHTYAAVGIYSVTLTVNDSAGGSATSSQTVRIVPVLPLTLLIGWCGILMDESAASMAGTPSAVFPGEYASNMELLLIKLKALGYDTVRVDFDPYCTDTVDFNYMSVYSQTNAQRAVHIAQHYGFWIVIDYHGYSDIFRNTSCWLSYWKPIVQNIGPLYSQII